MSPPNLCIEALTPKVTVLGSGAFEKLLGLDEVMRMGPHDGISAFIRRGGNESSLSQTHESTERRQPSASQEESPYQESTMLAAQTSSLQNCDK